MIRSINSSLPTRNSFFVETITHFVQRRRRRWLRISLHTELDHLLIQIVILRETLGHIGFLRRICENEEDETMRHWLVVNLNSFLLWWRFGAEVLDYANETHAGKRVTFEKSMKEKKSIFTIAFHRAWPTMLKMNRRTTTTNDEKKKKRRRSIHDSLMDYSAVSCKRKLDLEL